MLTPHSGIAFLYWLLFVYVLLLSHSKAVCQDPFICVRSLCSWVAYTAIRPAIG